MACEAYPIIEEGDVMNVVLLEPEKHENLYYVETIGQFDADMFRRLVCAFMNSTDDGYIWLGLDERARCRGIVLNRGYRDKIRREFCNTTFDCGYRPLVPHSFHYCITLLPLSAVFFRLNEIRRHMQSSDLN